MLSLLRTVLTRQSSGLVLEIGLILLLLRLHVEVVMLVHLVKGKVAPLLLLLLVFHLFGIYLISCLSVAVFWLN